jgi:phosphoglycolate phosphatase
MTPLSSRPFDFVVFDWDGTLLDSAGAIVRAMQAAARDLDLPEPSEARARHVIGLGLVDALSIAMPDLKPKYYNHVVERYRYHYLSQDHQLQLFPRVRETLDFLRESGVRLAVATGKSRQGLDRALDHTGLRPYFEDTRCADESASKPHPEMLIWLMDMADVAPTRTLMVGDTSHDIQMAHNAGTRALAVSFGAHPKEHLLEHTPLACVDSPHALEAWFRAWGHTADARGPAVLP